MCPPRTVPSSLSALVFDPRSEGVNRYRRGLQTCPQVKTSKSGHAIYFFFFDAFERRVWLSAESKYSRPLLDVFACIGLWKYFCTVLRYLLKTDPESPQICQTAVTVTYLSDWAHGSKLKFNDTSFNMYFEYYIFKQSVRCLIFRNTD